MYSCALKFHSFKSKITLNICGSKSISQRALIINSFITNEKIKNLSNSKDTTTLNKILSSNDELIDVKEGGTTLRFLLCLLSTRENEYYVKGNVLLKKRPIKDLIVFLKKLGVHFKFIEKDFNIPLIIKGGQLKTRHLIIDSNKTSQFASGIALIAPFISGGLKLTIKQSLVSKPYFDMTLKMMRECGINISNIGNSIIIKEGSYKKPYLNIESDWTSISYIYEIVSFSKNTTITCSKFHQESLQGDSNLILFFSLLGVETTFKKKEVLITKVSSCIKPKLIEWDICNNPDLFLTYVVTCLGLGINLKLTGINSLNYKESNRLQVIKKELLKFNASVKIKDNIFFLDTSGVDLKFSSITTYFDHRVALAFSPLVILTKKIEIDNYDVVSKSYPQFWRDLKKIGIKIITNNKSL